MLFSKTKHFTDHHVSASSYIDTKLIDISKIKLEKSVLDFLKWNLDDVKNPEGNICIRLLSGVKNFPTSLAYFECSCLDVHI